MDQKYIEEWFAVDANFIRFLKNAGPNFKRLISLSEFLRGLGLPVFVGKANLNLDEVLGEMSNLFKTVLSVHLKPAFRSLSLRKRKVSPEQLRYWTPDVRAQRQHLEVTWIASLFEKRKMLTIFRTS